MNLNDIRFTLTKQIVNLLMTALAIVGVMALFHLTVNWLIAGAIYGAASAIHGLWVIYRVGAQVKNQAVSAKSNGEKFQFGFRGCDEPPLASSADKVREARGIVTE